MEEIMSSCRITGGRVVKLCGIRKAGKLWRYKNADPQIHIEFYEPIRSFLFCCETGEMKPQKQMVTIYYRRPGESFSEVNTHKLEIVEYDRTDRKICMDFPVREIRIDPAEEKGSCEIRQFQIHPLEEKTTEQSLREKIPGEQGNKKVIFVTHDLSQTGAPLLVHNIAAGFKKRGYDVVVLSGYSGNGFLEEKYETLDIPVIVLRPNQEGYFCVSGKSLPLFEKKVQKEPFEEMVIRLLAEKGYGTAITNTIVSGEYTELMKDYGLKVVSLIHEMKTSITLYNFMEGGRQIERNADYIVFPNRFVEEDFKALFPGVKGRRLIRPQGIYLKQEKNGDTELLQQLGVGEDGRFIVSLGSAELRKGVDLFVSGAILFLNRNPDTDICFIWVGNFSSEELRSWLLDQVERSGWKDRIHLIPFIRDASTYKSILNRAEIFWAISREDPFPSTVLEAMDEKIPVVGFKGTGGIQIMLEEERGGLAEAFDLGQLTEWTEKILSDIQLRKQMTEKAKQYVEKLDFEEYVDFLKELSEREKVVAFSLNLQEWTEEFPVGKIVAKNQEEKEKELERAIAGSRFKRRNKEIGKELVILDTAAGSESCGDRIIVDSCVAVCTEIFSGKQLRKSPAYAYDPALKLQEDEVKILCGSDFLMAEKRGYREFAGGIKKYRNICLMGADACQLGIDQNISEYSKKLLRYILHSKYLHAVQDERTRRILEQIGIKNVVNTGCPSLWKLTKEHCRTIPTDKGKSVVVALEDGGGDEKRDLLLLQMLGTFYKEVYIWIRRKSDYHYLRRSADMEKCKIILPSLENLDKVLSREGVDYIGTQMYAGIRSLGFGRRSLIIGESDKAEAFAVESNLPFLRKNALEDGLEHWIMDKKRTEIRIPDKEIEMWKKQF